MQVRRNYLLAVWRVPALLMWITIVPLLFFAGRACRWRGHTEMPHYFHRGMCYILGLRVTYSGNICTQAPVLFVSNHISYLDIFPLGKIRGYFIAKSEVANWPVLGTYAQFQNTLFFERKTGRARYQLDHMQQYLRCGKSLILFAEGTSTEGTHVETFKSSLFESAAIDDPRVSIQPITIAYISQGGQRMNQAIRDYYAWYGTMPFGSHATALLPLKNVEIKVHFHPVCYLQDFDSRKACADHCQAMVAEKLQEFIG